jgi:hypothetical protein
MANLNVKQCRVHNDEQITEQAPNQQTGLKQPRI